MKTPLLRLFRFVFWITASAAVLMVFVFGVGFQWLNPQASLLMNFILVLALVAVIMWVGIAIVERIVPREGTDEYVLWLYQQYVGAISTDQISENYFRLINYIRNNQELFYNTLFSGKANDNTSKDLIWLGLLATTKNQEMLYSAKGFIHRVNENRASLPRRAQEYFDKNIANLLR